MDFDGDSLRSTPDSLCHVMRLLPPSSMQRGGLWGYAGSRIFCFLWLQDMQLCLLQISNVSVLDMHK
jgi:hypothetical protein